MMPFMIFQKSAPNIAEPLLVLIGILIVLLGLSSFYDWLKTKPWKKDRAPNLPAEADASRPNTTQSLSETQEDESKRSDLCGDVSFRVTTGS